MYEEFGFMCIHISRELLFHLDGLKTPKEVWDNIESLFGNHDELRGHILENDIIALQPKNFETTTIILEIQIPCHAMQAVWGG